MACAACGRRQLLVAFWCGIHIALCGYAGRGHASYGGTSVASKRFFLPHAVASGSGDDFAVVAHARIVG